MTFNSFSYRQSNGNVVFTGDLVVTTNTDLLKGKLTEIEYKQIRHYYDNHYLSVVVNGEEVYSATITTE